MNEHLLSLFLFAAAMTFSPGPNNVLMASSGVQVGVRRSIPLGLGIFSGMMLLLALSATGLASLVSAWPVLLTAIKAAGTIYLCWLAWKIASAGALEVPQDGSHQPYRFTTGLMNTLLNPKGWTAAVSAAAGYAAVAPSAPRLVLTLALVFAAVQIPNWALWCSCGTALSRVLRTDRHWRIANASLGSLIILSVVPMWTH
jgi:threonine/homoserine/homoserine lactone efflux protein